MFKGTKGPLLRMFAAQLENVKAAVMAKKDALGNKYQAIMSNVALLEYQTVTHDIFVDIFMNRDIHLCKANISGFKAYLQNRLQFFKNWYESTKRRGSKGAQYAFISTQTWTNLIFTVCGFISFSEYILANSKNDIYIPMLLSNTSFIEALFSYIRSLGSHDARSYPS